MHKSSVKAAVWRTSQRQKQQRTIKDSPTALASTVKTLVAMGLLPSDTVHDDVISIGDILLSTAFLFAKEYGPDDKPRYVGYKAHKHASLRIFQLLGPLYGQRDASHKWWEPYLSGWQRLASEGL